MVAFSAPSFRIEIEIRERLQESLNPRLAVAVYLAIGLLALLAILWRCAKDDLLGASHGFYALLILLYLGCDAVGSFLSIGTGSFEALGPLIPMTNVLIGATCAVMLRKSDLAVAAFVLTTAADALLGLVAWSTRTSGLWSGGLYRADALLGNPIPFALLCSVSLAALILAGTPSTIPPKWRWPMASILAFGVALSFTRSAVLALALAIPCGFAGRGRWRKGLVYGVSGLVCVAATFAFRTGTPHGARSVSSSDAWRSSLQGQGLRTFRGSPAFGTGLGRLALRVVPPREAVGRRRPTVLTFTKSQYLTLLCQLGLVGGVLIGFCGLMIARQDLSAGSVAASFLASSCVLLAVWGLVDDPILSGTSPYGDRLLGFLIGVALIIPRPGREALRS